MLKWVRGESFSDDHWVELFRLINLPRGLRLEELTFGLILNSASQIIANSAALKTLTQRSQSEVTLREALQELDIWGEEAIFILSDYTDSNGKHIKLIKDWNDIVIKA